MKLGLIVLVIALISGGTAMAAEKRDIRDIVGCAHVAGKYNLTDKDFLNEGADQLLGLGTRVIKLWFTPRAASEYSFNSNWPKIGSLVDLAKTPYFHAVFAKPFNTYILETFTPHHDDGYWSDGMTAEEKAKEQDEFYRLSKYLLTTYKGTGKTFIFQNWEGDWMLTNPKFTKEPSPVAIQGMIDWLNARQDGVEQARKEIGMHGVTVAHAAEVNLVARAMEGKVTVTNDVLPKTHCDLYSYSSWDSLRDPEKLRKALDYLASKAPDSKLFGSKNIFVGEYGAPENEPGMGPEKQLAIVKSATETALKWGARYVVYWELYCNEKAGEYEGRPTNQDCRGFWLIRPDGTKAPVWEYFRGLLAK
jgi:hypothetical protein